MKSRAIVVIICIMALFALGLVNSCYSPQSSSENTVPSPLSNEELSEKLETIEAFAVQGDDARAIQELHKIAEQYELTVEQQRGVYIIMGMLSEKTGQHDAMATYYRKAYWLDPEGQDAWMLRETILNYGYELGEKVP